jgi:hypothetical protein
VPNIFAPGKHVSVELGRAGFQRRLDHVCSLSFSASPRAHVVLLR